MQPPITHYKDEPADELTTNLVNDEIEKEVQMASDTKPVNTELKVLPVQKKEKKATTTACSREHQRDRCAHASIMQTQQESGGTQ